MHNAGGVCEQCRGGAFRNVVRNRCIKGSLAMSALVWLEATLHDALRLYSKSVSRFVVPSAFFKAKFAQWGLDVSRFAHIPNCIDADSMQPAEAPGERDLFVYVGRLVAEKGVHTLIRAAAKAQVRLRIIGVGPEEDALKQLAKVLGGEVEFTGFLRGAALRAAIVPARAVVIPSEWYENAPMSVMEASALALPVIGARIGGIPELIRSGESGFVFESGNVDSLVEVLQHVCSLDDSVLRRIGSTGREWMRSEFNPSVYRNRMLKLYEEIGVRTSQPD
jgi:glycosyltransferase involved in cell wall biosynthesis